MQTLSHKFHSASYYLSRPRFWSHFCHRGLGYLGSKEGDKTVAMATAWARKQARPAAQTLAFLDIVPEAAEPLPRFPVSEMRAAADRVRTTGARMGGGANVDLLYALAVLTRPRNVVETGVAFGWSSLAILKALSENGEGRLASVDRPYPGDKTERFVGAAVPDRLKQPWTIIREPDRNGLKRALKLFPEGLDLAHYDSDKTSYGRRFGYGLLWSGLKEGGLFVSDDIQDNLAFAQFVKEQQAPFGVIETEGKFVGLAVKPRRARRASRIF
jgi:predicted O-methyltransferase YrrM